MPTSLSSPSSSPPSPPSPPSPSSSRSPSPMLLGPPALPSAPVPLSLIPSLEVLKEQAAADGAAEYASRHGPPDDFGGVPPRSLPPVAARLRKKASARLSRYRRVAYERRLRAALSAAAGAATAAGAKEGRLRAEKGRLRAEHAARRAALAQRRGVDADARKAWPAVVDGDLQAHLDGIAAGACTAVPPLFDGGAGMLVPRLA